MKYKAGFAHLLLIFGIILLGISGIVYFATKDKQGFYNPRISSEHTIISESNSPTQITVSAPISITAGPTPFYPSPTLNPKINILSNGWQLFTDKTSGFQIELPPKLIIDEDQTIKVETTDEIKNFYKKAAINGCPGPCSFYIDDPSLLDKDFNYLSEVSQLPDCKMTEQLSKEIKNNFHLFANAIENKEEVTSIYNENLHSCGIKYIAKDGYDVSLFNVRYKAGFIVDGKIIRMNLPVFQYGISNEVNALWKELGYDEKTATLNYTDDGTKERQYFENLNLLGSIISKVSGVFDQSVKSLKLL